MGKWCRFVNVYLRGIYIITYITLYLLIKFHSELWSIKSSFNTNHSNYMGRKIYLNIYLFCFPKSQTKCMKITNWQVFNFIYSIKNIWNSEHIMLHFVIMNSAPSTYRNNLQETAHFYLERSKSHKWSNNNLIVSIKLS